MLKKSKMVEHEFILDLDPGVGNCFVACIELGIYAVLLCEKDRDWHTSWFSEMPNYLLTQLNAAQIFRAVSNYNCLISLTYIGK